MASAMVELWLPSQRHYSFFCTDNEYRLDSRATIFFGTKLYCLATEPFVDQGGRVVCETRTRDLPITSPTLSH